ncbi:hypothetical protein [Paractinoplanes atraurantiacus]|uniref:hypothetical protein n=1 Tax=Paractinoplanes atraurantiacus TaxID=1036182 RepID=UPI0011786D78|nr:hypothetical protein [Actinoplanes atraurantiacus]
MTSHARAVRVDQALPPGRLGCDLHAETLTLWTVQSAAAWETLTREGTISGREDLIYPYFLRAYTWLRAAATRRGAHYRPHPPRATAAVGVRRVAFRSQQRPGLATVPELQRDDIIDVVVASDRPNRRRPALGSR